MLYIKPINDITWDDVKTFCQQNIPENAYLDYKQDFPSHLEKTIAAMANTLGGIILIGVAEDKENKPIVPVKGIDFKKGLSERVMSIILTNIIPPVFPEIAVPCNKKGDKALLVVRIPQSHQPPHAIAENTEVYLRTGNRNKPEKIASINEIEWLRDHRKKSEDLREYLYSRANNRFDYLYEKQLEICIQGLFTISFCPLYPQKIFMNPPELNDVYRNIRVTDYCEPIQGAQFPLPDIANGKIAQDSILLYKGSDIYEVYYTELNSFGLYFFKGKLSKMRKLENGTHVLIHSYKLFCIIDEFYDSAIKYYNKLGYQGMLHFRAYLENLHGCELVDWRLGNGYSLFYSPDLEIKFSKTLLAGALEKEKSKLILEVVQHIGWTFGWHIKKELLDAYYKRHNPDYQEES